MSYHCDDGDYFNDDEACACPHCDGFATVNCYCGGDLCVCENYGERECPVCYGVGEVSDELYERYREREAKNAREWAAIFAKAEADQ